MNAQYIRKYITRPTRRLLRSRDIQDKRAGLIDLVRSMSKCAYDMECLREMSLLELIDEINQTSIYYGGTP
jgi:hypothetical protein